MRLWKFYFPVLWLKCLLIGMSISHDIAGAIWEVLRPTHSHTSYAFVHARHSLTMRIKGKGDEEQKRVEIDEINKETRRKRQKQKEESFKISRRKKRLSFKKNVEAINRIAVDKGEHKKTEKSIKRVRSEKLNILPFFRLNSLFFFYSDWFPSTSNLNL